MAENEGKQNYTDRRNAARSAAQSRRGQDAYVYDCVRTPRGRGKRDGGLRGISPVHLLKNLFVALRERNQLDTSKVDDVVLGCVTPLGEQGADIARTAVLYSGWAQN